MVLGVDRPVQLGIENVLLTRSWYRTQHRGQASQVVVIDSRRCSDLSGTWGSGGGKTIQVLRQRGNRRRTGRIKETCAGGRVGIAGHGGPREIAVIPVISYIQEQPVFNKRATNAKARHLAPICRLEV